MPGSPWIVVVVRAWSQGDGPVVRMTLSGRDDVRVTAYERSAVAAASRLAGWLDELARAPAATAAPDDPEDAAETAEGRSDDTGLLTVPGQPDTGADAGRAGTGPGEEEN
jgi:hypothetical protein